MSKHHDTVITCFFKAWTFAVEHLWFAVFRHFPLYLMLLEAVCLFLFYYSCYCVSSMNFGECEITTGINYSRWDSRRKLWGQRTKMLLFTRTFESERKITEFSSMCNLLIGWLICSGQIARAWLVFSRDLKLHIINSPVSWCIALRGFAICEVTCAFNAFWYRCLSLNTGWRGSFNLKFWLTDSVSARHIDSSFSH